MCGCSARDADPLPGRGWWLAGFAAALLTPGPLPATDLDAELAAALAFQATAAEAQARIDALDDETRRLRGERRTLADAEAAWRDATERLDARLAAQEQRLADLVARVADAERTAEQILPIMAEMVDTLEAFIELDMPFGRDARLASVRALRNDLVRPDLANAEKFRRVLDAYRRELDYGYGIHASRGLAPGTGRFVDLLRLGRTAWYFRSLDGAEAGVWDTEAGGWIALDTQQSARIARALAVVRGEAEPDFLRLPVVVPERLRP